MEFGNKNSEEKSENSDFFPSKFDPVTGLTIQ